MSNAQQQSTATTNRPVEEVYFGSVRAAIWRNANDSGVWHNVTFERSYRDGKEWRSTDSFGRDDLLLLAKVADQAHTWIIEAERKERSTERNQTESEGESPRLANASMNRGK